jgi:hypothetical protein
MFAQSEIKATYLTQNWYSQVSVVPRSNSILTARNSRHGENNQLYLLSPQRGHPNMKTTVLKSTSGMLKLTKWAKCCLTNVLMCYHNALGSKVALICNVLVAIPTSFY